MTSRAADIGTMGWLMVGAVAVEADSATTGAVERDKTRNRGGRGCREVDDITTRVVGQDDTVEVDSNTAGAAGQDGAGSRGGSTCGGGTNSLSVGRRNCTTQEEKKFQKWADGYLVSPAYRPDSQNSAQLVVRLDVRPKFGPINTAARPEPNLGQVPVGSPARVPGLPQRCESNGNSPMRHQIAEDHDALHLPLSAVFFYFTHHCIISIGTIDRNRSY